MEVYKFKCTVKCTDPQRPVGAELWLDQRCVFEKPAIDQPCTVEFEFEDTPGVHQISLVLTGKTFDHTELLPDGSIGRDSLLVWDDFEIDEINCSQVIFETAKYTHNFNGTQPEITDSFTGTMGCNGTASFQFTTPFYLWLLEHM
jgi:hypothetical protein